MKHGRGPVGSGRGWSWNGELRTSTRIVWTPGRGNVGCCGAASGRKMMTDDRQGRTGRTGTIQPDKHVQTTQLYPAFSGSRHVTYVA